MRLSVRERFLLLNTLPNESNFLTLKIVRKLQEDLSFSEVEIKEFEMETRENQIKWNLKKEKDKDVQIGEKATDIIVNALKKLDKENKLTMDFIPLYEKFVKE